MSDRAASDLSTSTRLAVESLSFHYPAGGFGLCLPKLELRSGDTLLLTGPSGSGKTTLLRLLAGLLPPQSGTLYYDGVATQQGRPTERDTWRLRHAGLVFQDFALLDYLTAEENALLPARFLRLRGAEWSSARMRASELANRLDLAPHWQRQVSALSQGERQRVAIVRSLVHSPGFLFADEPTAALDPGRRDLALELLEEHVRDSGAVLVLVTHDPEVIERFPHRLNLEALRA